MQTFLPKPSLLGSVKVLDNKRLGKQRLECLQILKALRGETQAWKNHPAVKMWDGCETALEIYFNLCCQEWVSRGFKNSFPLIRVNIANLKWPWWFGNETIHSSHRASLLYKMQEYYSQYNWTETPTNNLFWPVELKCKNKIYHSDKGLWQIIKD
jgi:hypothetical protein